MGQKMIILPHQQKMKFRNNLILKRFYLTAIGFYPNAGYHHKNRPSGSEDYILIYCIAGQGNITVAGRDYAIIPNSFFIIPKGKPHHYESHQETPWSIYWVHFNGELADGIYKRLTSQTAHHDVRLIAYEQSLPEQFMQICEMLENNFKIDQLEASSLNLLHFLSKLVYHKQQLQGTSEADSIGQSILYMKEHIKHNLTLEGLADQQNLSVSHFVRLFKLKMGVPPIHFFTQLKIQLSCQYLFFTDRNIKSICAELGFEDQYYFSRIFKKFIGISPANYRKTHKS